MSSFAGDDLFSSGPHRFHIGGLSLRHVVHEPPGAGGVQLTSLGRHGRAITQSGDLLADNDTAMQEIVHNIESRLDGVAHELVDDRGQAWPGVVMLSFEPEAPRRVGVRQAVRYRVQYLQVTT